MLAMMLSGSVLVFLAGPAVQWEDLWGSVLSLLEASQLGDVVMCCSLLSQQTRHKHFPVLPSLTTRLPHQLVQLYITLIRPEYPSRTFSSISNTILWDAINSNNRLFNQDLQQYLQETTMFPKDTKKTKHYFSFFWYVREYNLNMY